MSSKSKPKPKKLNLQEMSNSERMSFIGDVRERLRKKVAEARFWQSLLQVEHLRINGNIVYGGDEQPHGFYSRNKT